MNCPVCGNIINKSTGHINRAKKLGLNVYCSQLCSGIGRRSNKTIEQKKKEKAEYDREYRKKNLDRIKKRNQEYNKTPAGRAAQKRNRYKFKKRHLEYCRTPEYREWKRKYDQKYQAKKQYGEYYESAILLIQIKNEVDVRQTKQELNLYNKSLKRKRNYEKFKREELERNLMGNPK